MPCNVIDGNKWFLMEKCKRSCGLNTNQSEPASPGPAVTARASMEVMSVLLQ